MPSLKPWLDRQSSDAGRLPRTIFERPRARTKTVVKKPEVKVAEPEPTTNGKSHPFEFMWQRWGKNQDWRSKLEEKAAHKALDIPEDDVVKSKRIETNYNGLGFRELAVIGMLGLVGYMALKDSPAPAPAPAYVDTDTDTSTDVSFPQ